MSHICSDTECWVLFALLVAGIVGQAGLIWWARRAFDRRARTTQRLERIEKVIAAFEGQQQEKGRK